MSMNETTSHRDAFLEQINDNHNTTIKLRALADILPRALCDGEALCRGTEDGIGYFLSDIAKEMQQFNTAATDFVFNRKTLPDERQKKLQNLADG